MSNSSYKIIPCIQLYSPGVEVVFIKTIVIPHYYYFDAESASWADMKWKNYSVTKNVSRAAMSESPNLVSYQFPPSSSFSFISLAAESRI